MESIFLLFLIKGLSAKLSRKQVRSGDARKKSCLFSEAAFCN